MPPFRTVPHTVRLPLCGVVPRSLPTAPYPARLMAQRSDLFSRHRTRLPVAPWLRRLHCLPKVPSHLSSCETVTRSLPPRRLVRGTASDRPVHRALIWSALSAIPHANGPLTRFSSCAAMSMAAPQVVWDSENRKTFHRATFLRLATVASSLSEDKSAKPQVIGRTMAYFHFAGEERGC